MASKYRKYRIELELRVLARRCDALQTRIYRLEENEQRAARRAAFGARLRRIEELELSTRAYTGLLSIGVVTIGDLVQRTERELFALRNIGKKSVFNIRGELERIGLSLGMVIDDDQLRRPPFADPPEEPRAAAT